MSKSFDHEEVENCSVPRRKLLHRSNDLFIGNPVERILIRGRDLDHAVIELGGKLMFMVFPEVINGCIDHDFTHPALKGADHVRIRRFVPMDLFENLKKAVVQYLNSVILGIGVSITNSHSVSIERGV